MPRADHTQIRPPALLEYADLVTEMVAVKHPHQAGVAARRGVEY